MSTKTSIKRIALVAVSALGFGLLSIVPAKAVVTATGTSDFQIDGSTTAVGAAAGAFNAASSAAVEKLYVRSGTTTNTFHTDFGSLTALDALYIFMSKGAAAPAAAADLIPLDEGTVNSTNATIGAANLDVDGTGAIAAVTGAGVVVTTKAGQTAAGETKFTSAALPAGEYSIWVATDNTDLTATKYRIASVTSYDVGAPVTMTYNIDGLRQVGSAADESTLLTSKVFDSTGRSTFLVGEEKITHSFTNPVTSPVSNAMTNPSDTTAASAPTYTSSGATFAAYTVALDLTATSGTTANTIYTLTGVILNGVNAYGNDTMTYVNSATTNGLAGSLSLTSASTGAAITSIALANSQATTAANYVLTAKDSDGRVVKGVTPVLSASAGTVTTAVGTTVSNGTDSTFVYTAPATGTSATLTFTLSGGSAGNITLSVPVTIGATYGTSSYGTNMEVTANGGRLETSDSSDFDLSTAAAYGVTLDPANTTTISVAFNLQNVVGGAFDSPVSGANLSVSLGGSLPTAQRTLAASTVTTDSLGTATASIAVNTARTGENLTVTFSSGTASLGVATITFTAAATTISEIYAGPANAITQQAATATPITVTATDQYGQAAANKRVQLTIVGPSAPAGGTTVVVTDASGVASYTVAGTTALSGQTDTVTVTQFEGSGVTAQADDIVTISYVASAPTAASFGVSADLSQGTSWTTYTTTTLATAIETANNIAAAGAKFEDAAYLPIDSKGDWTDTATVSGAAAAAQDEVLTIRFRALNASSVALAGIPVVISASSGAWIVGSLGTAVASRTRYTDASGYVSVTVFATKTGTATWTATNGSATASISVEYRNDVEDARFVAISPSTDTATSGTLKQYVATVTDRYGNVVPGVTVTWSELGVGRLEGNSGVTSAAGTSTADFSTYATEAGSGSVKASIAAQGDDDAAYVGAATSSYTNGLSGIAAAAAGIGSASAAITVSAPTTKSAEVLASEAAEAEAKKATTAAGEAKTEAAAATAKAADALAEAKLATAAATKAGTDAVAAADAAKAEAKLATAAAKANGEELAKVIKSLADLLALVTKNDADLKAAAEAAVDAALEAIDAANAATDAANTGAEASDASIVAAEEARDAADAATATAEEARDAATEAIDAANAATDAANLALEAAEAATVAAEEARDAADAATAAVEALASEVSTLIAGVTAQIKTLGNVVAKIAKKVKA